MLNKPYGTHTLSNGRNQTHKLLLFGSKLASLKSTTYNQTCNNNSCRVSAHLPMVTNFV